MTDFILFGIGLSLGTALLIILTIFTVEKVIEKIFGGDEGDT